MMASHTNGIHRTRSHRLRVLHSGCRQASWAMMTRQARRSSAIQHDTVRCGFLSRRSYVAPSRRSRGSAKRPRKELTYCPIYGFKPCVICAKDLTPALFCCLRKTRHQHAAWCFFSGSGWRSTTSGFVEQAADLDQQVRSFERLEYQLHAFIDEALAAGCFFRITGHQHHR